MNNPKLTEEGWRILDELALGEYGTSLQKLLSQADSTLAFSQLGRLMAVWIKHPFAKSFPYDPGLPTNWAKSRRCWEIEQPVALETIREHQSRFDILAEIAAEWERPIDFIAEYNVFHSLCKRLRPVVCGESKALENAEKISRELQRTGVDTELLSPNQFLGAISVTIAGYLAQSVPILSGQSPLITGATLLAVCFGHRKFCKLLTSFETSYDKSKDSFGHHRFPVCGAINIRNQPCRNRVRSAGDKCWLHRKEALPGAAR